MPPCNRRAAKMAFFIIFFFPASTPLCCCWLMSANKIAKLIKAANVTILIDFILKFLVFIACFLVINNCVRRVFALNFYSINSCCVLVVCLFVFLACLLGLVVLSTKINLTLVWQVNLALYFIPIPPTPDYWINVKRGT